MRLAPAVAAHGSALLGLFFLLKAWSYWLDRYLLLYGDNGVVVGASYTDIHVELPVLWLLASLAIAAACASLANMRRRDYRVPVAAVLLVSGGSFLLAPVYPALFHRFYVKPSELELEAPFIARNIALTRRAYGPEQIEVKPFPAEQGLDLAKIEPTGRPSTMSACGTRHRCWIPMRSCRRSGLTTSFSRWTSTATASTAATAVVMLSAREFEPAMLPANAKTWVNLHLLFTHGSGIVMSPVTEKSAEGLPSFYLQDIPPVAAGGPPVGQPRIYFGEGTRDYVIVKGSVPEFDYPQGKDNAYTSYQGGTASPSAARAAHPVRGSRAMPTSC